MFVDLPGNFGAGLRRKRAFRAAPRRRKAFSTGDPVQDLRNEAEELGYVGDLTDIAAMMQWAWNAHASDGMGELMEELIAMGYPAPW